MKCLVYGAADYECSFKRSELYNTQQVGNHAQLLPLMLKCYINSDLKNLPSFNSPIYTADDPDFELQFLDDLGNPHIRNFNSISLRTLSRFCLLPYNL